MKVLILPSAAAAADRVAGKIAALISALPTARLGLATGGTMAPVYATLVAHRPQMGRVVTFNLDEYVGLAPDHPQSYRSYMNVHLFDPIGMAPGQTHLPRGDAPDPRAEALRYEAAIARGGLDLQLLGLGANGHIGFNEPSSSLASRSRVKTLAPQTRADNARYFDDPDEVPRFAITMGIATIMEARHVVVLATGARKASAVAAMVEGPVSALCPASILQMHPRATIVMDPAAAAQLSLRDYYEAVHPGGSEPDL